MRRTAEEYFCSRHAESLLLSHHAVAVAQWHPFSSLVLTGTKCWLGGIFSAHIHSFHPDLSSVKVMGFVDVVSLCEGITWHHRFHWHPPSQLLFA